MIYDNNAKYNEIVEESFVNSYISDYELPEWDDKILIIKSKKGIPKNIITSCIAEYKVNDSFVYVYNIPEEYEKNYYLIVNNKQLLLDENYKSKLLNFWEETFNSLLHCALYKPLYRNVSKFNLIDCNNEFTPSKEIYWRE